MRDEKSILIALGGNAFQAKGELVLQRITGGTLIRLPRLL